VEFLISTSYRTTGKSVIWKLDTERGELESFREDQAYRAGERRKDQIYFGMEIWNGKLYCVGGSVLSVLDLQGNLLQRQELDLLRDAHDLKMVAGQIFCTNTGHDTLEVFAPSLEHRQTVHLKELPCFQGRKLLMKNKRSPDALHANFLAVKDGRLLVTHSFTCEKDMRRAITLAIADRIGDLFGKPSSRIEGVVLSLRSGKVLSSGGVIATDGRRILDGVHGAHDGLFYDSKYYINATHNIETLVFDQDLRPLQTIQYNVGMLLRGLYPLDNSTLLVGSTRIDPQRTAAGIYRRVLKARGGVEFDHASSIKIVDVRTGTIVDSTCFDTFQGVHPEIYKIIPLKSDHDSPDQRDDWAS
jgi:hypothetical protein